MREFDEIYPDGPITNGDKKLKEMMIEERNSNIIKEMRKTDYEKTDYDKFLKERNAATHLRDELVWLVGYTNNSPDDRVINERLKAALAKHEEARCKDWI